MKRNLCLVVLLSFLFVVASAADVLCKPLKYDFETGDLQGWKVVSGSFGALISDRTECRNRPGEKLNKQGRYFLSTIEKADGNYNDGYVGRLVSPVFKLKGQKITLLVGGGGHPETYIALCTMDGKEVFTARGPFDEHMTAFTWDARAYIGKDMFFVIVDNVQSGWGHLTVDDINLDAEPSNVPLTKVMDIWAQKEKQKEKDKEIFVKERKQLREEMEKPEVLFARGSSRVYSGRSLEAVSMPVGGIGVGCIQINGKGELAQWQIFNNFQSVKIPESLLAVRIKHAGKTVVRALQTDSEGDLRGMQSVEMRGEYPFAWYDFKDKTVPVSVGLEVYNPLIPMNARDSAIPCAIFRVTVKNTTSQHVEMAVMQSQQNAVGYDGLRPVVGRSHDGYILNRTRLSRTQDVTVLNMTSRRGPLSGSMALACMSRNVTGLAYWKNTKALVNDLSDDGKLKGPALVTSSTKGKTISGALSATAVLAPGESRTVTFVLTWFFPVVDYGSRGWGGASNMYYNWWNDAAGVARYVCANHSRLYNQSKLYHDTFYQSNLPQYMLDRISSQVAILRSKTVFWAANGFIGAYEGCGAASGCCAGNCVHVWHYAQAHARLFPEIGRKFREQEFMFQTEDGGIPHRELNGFGPAADGHLGAILGAYREHLTSADNKWLNKHWQNIRRAMDYAVAAWDKDEDGVLAGAQWNTLDANLGGSTTWIGSLYLASLAACEKMAVLQNETDVAKRYRTIRMSGSIKQDQTLFNGEYFFQIPDPQPYSDYNAGCHIDQLLGQWWGGMLNLGAFYPENHMRDALSSLFKYNFKRSMEGIKQVPRKFVDDNDSAMQMISFPRGDRPDPAHTIPYADEVMSGFEYSAAGAMIQAGMLKEGFTVVKAISNRYDGVLRSELTGGDSASWGYSGNPFGDDECGKFYARAMSSWGLLLACQGFIYDGPDGSIGFKPVWSPEDHASFFTAAEGWGLYRQERSKDSLSASINLKYGKLSVKRVLLSVPADWNLTEARAAVNNKKTECSMEQKGSDVTVTFTQPIDLRPGNSLRVVLEK